MNTINPENLPQIVWQNHKVITTELLAQCYGAQEKQIRQNHANHKNRFEEGKHFFKLEGEELRAFKHRVTDSHSVECNNEAMADLLNSTFNTTQFGQAHKVDNIDLVDIDPRAKHFMLWTEKGAVRHAKILDTDQAWEVQERLEEVYFHPERKNAYIAPNSGLAKELAVMRELIATQRQLVAAKETQITHIHSAAQAHITHLEKQLASKDEQLAGWWSIHQGQKQHQAKTDKAHAEELACAVRALRPMQEAEEREIKQLFDRGFTVRMLEGQFYRSKELVKRAIRNQGGAL